MKRRYKVTCVDPRSPNNRIETEFESLALAKAFAEHVHRTVAGGIATVDVLSASPRSRKGKRG